MQGKVGNGVHGRELHGFIDRGSAHVERSAEDEGETEHVVHLIGMIGTPGGHDQILTNRNGQVVIDFRVGIGHSKNDRVGCHGCNHLRAEDVAARQANKHIGTFQRLGQRISFRSGSKEPLVLVEICPVFVQQAFGIKHQQVFGFHSEADEQFAAGDGRCTGTVDHHFHRSDVFVYDTQGIDQSGTGDDGGTVLIVVHDRDIQFLFQAAFDFKAFGGFDIFQVYPAERGFERFYDTHEFIHIGAIDFEIEYINIGEEFE